MFLSGGAGLLKGTDKLKLLEIVGITFFLFDVVVAVLTFTHVQNIEFRGHRTGSKNCSGRIYLRGGKIYVLV